MNITFDARSENEAFARVAVAAFITYKDPSVLVVDDIKTAVSEAVTNAIIHGYDGKDGIVDLKCILTDRRLTVIIKDYGKGIEDIEKAREPLYTSKPDCERSGLGFTVMESFMDSINVDSQLGKGTIVTLCKDLI